MNTKDKNLRANLYMLMFIKILTFFFDVDFWAAALIWICIQVIFISGIIIGGGLNDE